MLILKSAKFCSQNTDGVASWQASQRLGCEGTFSDAPPALVWCPHKCCPNKTPLGAAEETATDPPKPISDDSGWFVYVALYDK